MPPSVIEEIPFPSLPGMVDVLRRMLYMLGLTSIYTLYRAQITPTQREYWADVCILGLPPDDRRQFLFKGQSMPTPALAYQMAAWEAIARVRFLYVPPDCRYLNFFPYRGRTGGITRFPDVTPNLDPAIGPMLHLFAAQYDLFIDVVEELVITRKALGRLLEPPEVAVDDPLTLAPPTAQTAAEDATMVLNAPLAADKPRHRLCHMPAFQRLRDSFREKEDDSFPRLERRLPPLPLKRKSRLGLAL
jgi:hypothetical protein